MQLHFRGRSTHVLECQGSETIGKVKDRIASLESLKATEISLYAAGVPVSDDHLIAEFEDTDIELTVGLPGGRVHGSLSRAGKVKKLTPQVEKKEKKKKKTGRAKKRLLYNKRFKNVMAATSGQRRGGPNSNYLPPAKI